MDSFLASGLAKLSVNKTGSGVQIFSGINTYAGLTTISGGELLGGAGGSCSNSVFTASSGGTNGVQLAAGNNALSWYCAGLTNKSGSGLDFDANNNALSTSIAPLQVLGSVVITNPTVYVKNVNGVLALGDYPIIAANAGGGGGTISIYGTTTNVTAPMQAGALASLVVSGSTLNLHVSAATATTLSQNVNPSSYGGTVTFTATVSTNGATAAAATGSVTFKDGATTLGTVSLSSGVASLPINSLTAGGHTITAVYGGDNYYNASTSAGLSQTVNKVTPSFALLSSAQTNGYHASVSFTANAFAADLTGTVQFTTNGANFGSPVSISSQSATSGSITNLPRGTNVITAGYSGDSNYLGITNVLNQIVTNHPPVATVMTVNRTAGLNVLISIADVKTNITDVDGDTVSFNLNLGTTNGVTLLTNSSWIFYTNHFNVNDQINYVIGDGYGGTNTGYVNIVVSNSVTGTNSITAQDFTSPYSNSVTAYGIPGYYYILERATNLAAPVWIDVQTNQAATNGIINAVDTFWDLGGVKPSPSAFYQLKWQP